MTFIYCPENTCRKILVLPDIGDGTVEIFCPRCKLIYIMGYDKKKVEDEANSDDPEEWHDPDVEGQQGD